MISPGIVYLVLSAALFAVAAVTHFHATSLSVPIPAAMTIITAILPILALINAYIRPNLLLTSHRHHPPPSLFQRHLPTTLQTMQLLLTTILATLLLQATISTDCAIDDQWMRMFRGRVAQSIRTIQDVLECCGLNSVRDRAYPFGQPSTCKETYGRDRSCRQAWTGVMRMSAGLDFGVVLAVALLQLVGLLMMKEGASWWTAWRIWSGRYKGTWSTTERQNRRPLLAAPAEEEEEEDEEAGVVTSENERREYGTGGDGPRVEPSSMGERNAWEE